MKVWILCNAIQTSMITISNHAQAIISQHLDKGLPVNGHLYGLKGWILPNAVVLQDTQNGPRPEIFCSLLLVWDLDGCGLNVLLGFSWGCMQYTEFIFHAGSEIFGYWATTEIPCKAQQCCRSPEAGFQGSAGLGGTDFSPNDCHPHSCCFQRKLPARPVQHPQGRFLLSYAEAPIFNANQC